MPGRWACVLFNRAQVCKARPLARFVKFALNPNVLEMIVSSTLIPNKQQHELLMAEAVNKQTSRRKCIQSDHGYNFLYECAL